MSIRVNFKLILCYDNYINSNISETRHNFEMEIQLTSDVPFHFAPRRLSAFDKTQVYEIVSDLQSRSIIRPSDSPYSSPIVLVKKKDGATRMCVDFRALNKLTVRDNYPLPLIVDCLEYLEGKRFFSVLDLKNGFHQIKVADDSVRFTSFVTPGSIRVPEVPFGLKNAVFQRFMTKVLQPFINNGELIVYLDDIIIATPDFDSHLDILSRLLNRLSEFRLKLNLQKCQFCFSELEYLGYLVNECGIRPGIRQYKKLSYAAKCQGGAIMPWPFFVFSQICPEFLANR